MCNNTEDHACVLRFHTFSLDLCEPPVTLVRDASALTVTDTPLGIRPILDMIVPMSHNLSMHYGIAEA